ncbi:HAD family hydrolase [Shewanella waksmanii]|uniref:HAD family hydrolase n=1 Tax=Shewanella waksmanii TaxID=213783 RepID=UPI00048CFECD|nr:HAD-IA family hydrolase [Shewanella waksmanii]
MNKLPLPPQASIKAVLFDLDGTLADTAADLVAALNLALIDHGHEAVTLDAMRHVASDGSLALVKASTTGLNDEQLEQVRQSLLTHYASVNGQQAELFTGMAALLTALSDRNIAFGLVTNKPARYTRPYMDQTGLTSKMATIISGDTTTLSKPHAAPMLLAAQQMAIEPQQILYLGDALRDLEAAKVTNMLGGVAGWGYIKDADSAAQWPHHFYFNQVEEIIKTIDAINQSR